MSKFKDTFGPWAVVTGASSGIGEEFAGQLAARGINLVMLARRKEKMDVLGKQLGEAHGIDFRSVGVDLSDPDFLEVVKAATDDLDVGLLVSNAGAGAPGKFLNTPAENLSAMLRLNVLAHLQLSHHFANRLVNGRESGGILLVSSMAGFQGVPYIADYSAAKGYILNLGEALNRELDGTGIRVSVLVPGPTKTPMIDTMEANMESIPMPYASAEQVAAEALAALEKNKPYHVPGRLNRLMSGLMGRRLLTRNAAVSMWGTMMKRTLVPQQA